jgi:hypothetical protein
MYRLLKLSANGLHQTVPSFFLLIIRQLFVSAASARRLRMQGDQIGRIFAHWAIIYILWVGFQKLQK